MGYFESTEDELIAIQQNLRSLLVTNWGERVMHYNFGCNLREFLFEQIRDGSLKELIADRIMNQVTTWMPFVTLDELNVVFSDEDASIPDQAIGVRIKFRISSRPDFSSVFSFVVTP